MNDSGDSEEVFEEEELSSSECNSGEEDSAYNSNADNDMFSNDGSMKDPGLNSVADSRADVKLAAPDGVSQNDPSKQQAFGDSEDSDVFDQEEQQKLNW